MSRNPAYHDAYTALDGAPRHTQTLHRYPWQDDLDIYFDELAERGRPIPVFNVVGGAGEPEHLAPVDARTPLASIPPETLTRPAASLASDVIEPAGSSGGLD